VYRAVAAMLDAGHEDFSLCHGLAGKVAILLYGALILEPERECAFQIAQHAAQIGIRRYGTSALFWPCGMQEGTSPSVMLGVAGIGLFYLRFCRS
jgi:hypothetical protein